MNELEHLIEEFVSNLKNLKDYYLTKLKMKNIKQSETENSLKKQIERIDDIIYRNTLTLNEKSAEQKFNESEEKLKKLTRELEQRIEERTIELKKSEAKYRQIINDIVDIIVETDLDGKIAYVSSQCYNILGYPQTELIGMEAFDLIHPDDLDRVDNTISEAIKSKKPVYYESRLRHEKGHYLPMSFRAKVIDMGGSLRIVGVLSDITEKIEAEQKLKDSEEWFRIIFDNAPDGLYLSDLKGNFVDGNKAAEKLLGYTKEELIGKNFLKLNILQNDQISRATETLLKDSRTESTGPGELTLIRKDGSKILVEVRTFPIKFKERNLVLGIARDITKRKIMEETLEASEEKYRRLYENSPNSLILTNKNGIILDCNSETKKIFGYEKEEMIGVSYPKLGIISSKYITLFKKRLLDFEQGKTLKPIEIQVTKKNGTTIWVNYQSSMFKLGNDIYIESICQDITEKKKAEKLIQEEIEILKDLDKVRKDLITRASHELKTPLTSIGGATELFLNFYTDHFDDEVRSLIEIIDKGGKRLKSFIEDLLDVSRIESNNLESKKQKANIVIIIKGCIDDVNYLISEREQTLNHDFKEDLYVKVDIIRIEQVILNILSNAIKNTPPKGTISIELKKLDGFVEIKVSDTGVGFTEEEKIKIFKRFGKIERFEEDLDVDIGGSGLGLYISKELVELHEGTIWLESEGRNKGTTVYINLPLS